MISFARNIVATLRLIKATVLDAPHAAFTLSSRLLSDDGEDGGNVRVPLGVLDSGTFTTDQRQN